MAYSPARSALAVVALIGTAVAAAPAAPRAVDCRITSTAIGPIRIGMTLEQVKAALPRASFELVAGIDDIAFLEIRLGKEQLMLGEIGDSLPPGQSWPNSTPLRNLETYSAQCRDENGIGPGTSVHDAAARMGGIKEIVMSDAESRQYVTFVRQPKGRWYRIDDTGLFSVESPRRTNAYRPGARIVGVGVDGLPHR
jgi:hypothetical protein